MQALVAAWVWEALVEGGNVEKGQGGRRHRGALYSPSTPVPPLLSLLESTSVNKS